MITLISDEGEIQRLLLEVNAPPHIRVDWVRDNGELYLEGDCLTQCGLTGNRWRSAMISGEGVIELRQGVILVLQQN
ncbi:TPA: hypothetical protein ACIAIE_000514 [Serratia fonticola]|uniref:hypothetical protein n=1 Tax=Serratia fonticola TaxID=47917 RepID=UPI001377EFE8|nr:hypothetical protein [Serratia fonticola]NBJ36548.1 hypothetical protein [Serratia fonticola]